MSKTEIKENLTCDIVVIFGKEKLSSYKEIVIKHITDSFFEQGVTKYSPNFENSLLFHYDEKHSVQFIFCEKGGYTSRLRKFILWREENVFELETVIATKLLKMWR